MILSNSTRDLHYKSKSQEMYLQINVTLRYEQQLYVPINKSYHHSRNWFRVHVLKSADAHWNERLEFITFVGWVHHMETIGEDQVEGKILGEGLSEVCLELLQDIRHVTMATIWLDLHVFACEWIVVQILMFHNYKYTIPSYTTPACILLC